MQHSVATGLGLHCLHDAGLSALLLRLNMVLAFQFAVGVGMCWHLKDGRRCLLIIHSD